MAKDSQYTDQVIRYMKRENRPVTATEIQEAVGASRQGMYYWLKSEGADKVVPVGTGRYNATAYVLRDGIEALEPKFRPHRHWTVTNSGRRAKRPQFALGQRYRVTGMRIEDDETIVEFAGEEGAAGAAFTVNTSE